MSRSHFTFFLTISFALVLCCGAQAQSLVITTPVYEGVSSSVSGSGSYPSSMVELFKNGVSQGSVKANASGQFTFGGVSLAENDVLYVQQQQTWNFYTPGNAEGWVDNSGGVGGSATVSGSVLTYTVADPGSNPSLFMGSLPGHPASSMRVLEVRIRNTGTCDGFYVGTNDTVTEPPASFSFLGIPTGMTGFQTFQFPLVRPDGALPEGNTNNWLYFVFRAATTGDLIEFDYIRVREYFDWNFDNGDTMGWNVNSGFAGGISVVNGKLTGAASGDGSATPDRLIYEYPWSTISDSIFTLFEVGNSSSQGSGGAIWGSEFTFSDNDGLFGSWNTVGGVPTGDGSLSNITHDLLNPVAPSSGDWGPGVNTNFLYQTGGLSNGGTFEVDYFRLRPATIYGPSAGVTVSAGPDYESGYYVSFSEGNDSNSGTSPMAPWKTFTNLNSRTLLPGEKVFLKRGDTWASSKLRLTGKGVSGNPITLTAYGTGANPIITGINLTTEACIVLENPSYFNVDSMDCRNAKVGLYLRYTGGNTDGTGPMFNNQSVKITCCNFQNMDQEWSDSEGNVQVVPPYELSWGSGIWLGGNLPAPPGGPHPSETTNVLNGFQVHHCSFQECSTGVGCGWYFPPKYYQRLTNITLEDSWVTGCENGSFALFDSSGATMRRWDSWLGGNGFYSFGTCAGFLECCTNFLIDDCEFAGNKRNGTGNDGVGFDFEGDTHNVSFTNNVVHTNDGAGLLLLETQGGHSNLLMQHNTIWNDCRNPKESGQNKELSASSGAGTGNFGNNGVYLGSDVMGGLAVYNSTSRWNSNFGASTSGNRTSTAWSSVSGRAVQWDSVGYSGMQWESPDTWVNTRARRWVLVQMSAASGTQGTVWFQTETDATWTADKSVAFTIPAGGGFQNHWVHMGDCAKYKGVVTKWRVNANSGTISLNHFSSRPEAMIRSAASISPTSIDVQFNMPMLPQGGVLNPAYYSVSGAGQGSVSSQPNHVTQLATESGPVYRLTWDSGNMTDGLVTVTVSNMTNARGVAVLSGTQYTLLAEGPEPTATMTATPTFTPVPPTATNTPVPTETSTSTPLPTATNTATEVPPTATSVPPTATATATGVVVEPTATEVPPTATATSIPAEPTAVPTPVATAEPPSSVEGSMWRYE